MHDRQKAPEHRVSKGHRRRADLLLTAMTALLFIGFLTMITVFPKALSPAMLITVGFGLLAYSVVATFLYQIRLERRQGVGEQV